MDYLEFKRAQFLLGLSDSEFAERLGCSPQQVRRLRMPPGVKMHRDVSVETASRVLRLLARQDIGVVERADEIDTTPA